LAGIAKNYQVLGVTHLPQVEAPATCHLVETKDQSKDRAVEIARMCRDSKAMSASGHAEEMFGG